MASAASAAANHGDQQPDDGGCDASHRAALAENARLAASKSHYVVCLRCYQRKPRTPFRRALPPGADDCGGNRGSLWGSFTLCHPCARIQTLKQRVREGDSSRKDGPTYLGEDGEPIR
jgi:hypothetical protein